MRNRRLNLVEKFSILSFVCIALLSLTLALVTTRVLTRNMLEWEWQGTAELVRYQVRAYALERLFTDRDLQADHRRFRESLGSLLSLPEVVRVKVWNRQGAVIWSDDDRLIGRTFPGNRELREALGGAVSVQLKDLKKAEHVHERERFEKLAEVYVPIFSGTDPNGAIGVLEMYKVPTRLSAQIHNVTVIVWSTSLAGGIILYLSLFGIVRVAYQSQLRLAQHLERSQVEIAVKEAKNADLDSFIYSVSHDLKSPLVAIEGMASLVLSDCGDRLGEDARHYLARLQANVHHMEELIGDLLTLSRVGRESRAPEVVGLGELVDEFVAEQDEQLRAHGVKVVVRDDTMLHGIRRQLEQVLSNLLCNAVKYMGAQPAPMIEVGAIPRDGFVECYVRDNGIGIEPAYHDKVFEIFQRLHEVAAEGTGVGLAIVKKIVDAAGGRIWVESEKGTGATFRFTWPVVEGGSTDGRP